MIWQKRVTLNWLLIFSASLLQRNHGPGGLHRISSIQLEMKSDLDSLKDFEVDIRFNKPYEWKYLSNDQRQKCILTRRLQNANSGSGGGKKWKGSHNQTNEWRRKIEEQGRIISALKTEKKESEQESEKPVSGNDTSVNKVTFNKGVTQQKKE